MPPSGVRIGAVLHAGPYHVRAIDYPPGYRQPEHHHDAPSITLVLAGDIRETTRTADEFGGALSVVAKPAGVRHANHVGPRGARTVQVACVPGGGGAPEPTRWQWSHGGSASAPLLRLASALRAPGGSTSAVEDLVTEAIAAAEAGGRARGDVPGWLARVKQALDDQLEAGVSIGYLAALAGAHPVSVSRAFRRHFGVTVTEYRRRERVRRAAGRIAVSAQSLSAVGHGTGHADHAHLCREFRRLTGLTPSEYRRITCTG